ncbi:MAG: pyridoxamine 5'-phosphate oxidase family protein [Nocardioides sp.]
MSDLADLSYETCHRLLQEGSVGRVAVCTPSGPRILPVNYTVADEAIVFRTTPYSVLGSVGGSMSLAFEVDSLDYRSHEGWSVVAIGRASVIHDAEEIASLRAELDLETWATGSRQLYVKLPWDELTGRRVGHPAAASAV